MMLETAIQCTLLVANAVAIVFVFYRIVRHGSL